MELVKEPPTPSSDCHLTSVSRYLRFLGCPRDLLDDLVQEVALAGLKQWPSGDAPVPFLLATARNQLRNAWRSRGRNRELADIDRLDDLWQQHVVDAGQPMQDALQQCLRELPERARTVLQLRYGENLDRKSIADRVGLGVEGVKSLLVRLRDQLGRCVRRRMGDE